MEPFLCGKKSSIASPGKSDSHLCRLWMMRWSHDISPEQVRSCPSCCLPPEGLKVKAERCYNTLKKLTSSEVRNQVKHFRHLRSSNSAQTLAVGRTVNVFLLKTADQAEQLRTAESWDYFPFCFLCWLLDLKPCAWCPSNQILGWDKTDEHDVPRRDLGFCSFAGQGHCTYNLYHRER